MCRLLALHSDQPVTADFWLLDAPCSLLSQSRFNAAQDRAQQELRRRLAERAA